VVTTNFLAATRVGDELMLASRSRGSGRSVTTREIDVTVAERVVAVASCTLVTPSSRVAPVEPTGDMIAPVRSGAQAPSDCPSRPYQWPDPASISSWLDVRLADGAADRGLADGRALLWVRVDGVPEQDGPVLALAADHVAFVGGMMLSAGFGMRTVHQTVRFRAGPRDATEWVLVEVAVDAVDGHVAHGRTRMWTQAGRLLALGEQTLLVTAHDRS
jgi:acyl-CoA thioesterase